MQQLLSKQLQSKRQKHFTDQSIWCFFNTDSQRLLEVGTEQWPREEAGCYRLKEERLAEHRETKNKNTDKIFRNHTEPPQETSNRLAKNSEETRF